MNICTKTDIYLESKQDKISIKLYPGRNQVHSLALNKYYLLSKYRDITLKKTNGCRYIENGRNLQHHNRQNKVIYKKLHNDKN